MNTDLPSEWTSVFDKTLEVCQEDSNYPAYSVREKMLAFVFTFLLNVKGNKISSVLKQQRIPFLNNPSLNELKKVFFGYCDTLILEGTNSGEIQARPFIANYYRQLLWNSFVAILYFWAKDTSEHKENTDVMVEKTIHFTFDLLVPNAIDSGLDLIRNVYNLRSKSNE